VVTPFPVLFRAAEARDLGFIVDSWLESYHDGNPQMQAVRFAHYKHPMRRIVRRIITRSQVWVACDPEDDGFLYGFIAAECVGNSSPQGWATLVHYVYVLQTRRREGLAERLSQHALGKLGALGWSQCTHMTRVAQGPVQRRRIDFNPFPVFEMTEGA
jgi:GNAT superfamily N-acetyltransferase